MILRSTDVRSALRAKQRGFIIDPFKFGGGGGTASDLLLKFDDQADASTTLTDTSGNSRTVTAQGNAQIDTAQSKYGAGSMLLDGSGDYAIATLPAFNYAINSFYVAGWFRFTSTGDQGGLFSWGNGEPYYLHHVIGRLYLGDGSNNILSPIWTPAANTWYHISLAHLYPAEQWWIRVDGVTVGSTGLSLNQSSPTALNIGSRPSQGAHVNGHVDDVVLVLNDPVHTSDFTPAEWT
jgi:hypothetical protein